MKTLSKISLLSFAASMALSVQADVLDFKALGKTGRYCPGDTLSVNTSGRYVERMLISAEGIRIDGFIKVYADGELVHNIGVPGYDPDYSFRVRRHVNNITLKFERTCSRVLDGKIFSPSPAPVSYRPYHREAVVSDNWGTEFLDISRTLSRDLQFEPDFLSHLWPEVLLPMKKIALLQNASEQVRSERSLITAHRSLKLAKVVADNNALIERLLYYPHFDYLVMDLLRIKEDVLERYDVQERELAKTIKDLETALDLGE